MPRSRGLGVWPFPIMFNSLNCPIAVAAVCLFCRKRKLRLRSTHDLADLTQWIFSGVRTCTWIHKPTEDQSWDLGLVHVVTQEATNFLRGSERLLASQARTLAENLDPLPQPQPVQLCVPIVGRGVASRNLGPMGREMPLFSGKVGAEDCRSRQERWG